MESIFNGILIASLYATVVGVITLLIKIFLKNKLSPKWHYIIWSVFIIKLLVPFGPESTVSLFNIVPRFSQPTQQLQTLTIDQYNSTEQDNDKILSEKDSSQSVMDIEEDTGVVKEGIHLFTLLSYVWLVGAVFIMLWMIFSYYSLHKKLHKSTYKYKVDDKLLSILEECKVHMAVKRKMPLLIQDVVSAPSLHGIINPVILLTTEVVKLNEKEVRYILLHELAHYKRKDILMNFLLIILQIIHWFNPIVWYCFRQIRQDMELSTDDEVLSKLEGAEYKEYARALVTVLERFNKVNFVPRLLSMSDNRKSVERRIRMIKKKEFFRNKKKATIVIGVICLVFLGGAFLTNGISDDITSKSAEFYQVDENSKDIETAVSLEIKQQGEGYGKGEYLASGHIVLGTEKKKDKVKVYTLASVGWFGFENGIFTKISGTGVVPTVITFLLDKNGQYSLIEYSEPLDGAGYTDSIKDMFPKKYHNRVFAAEEEYNNLAQQQEGQALEYLKSINREAEVSERYVEKELLNINVDASNKLFAEFAKSDALLNNCPNWIGIRELIEDGVKYIYETSQSKTNDNYPLIIFKKKKEDGTIVEERSYKIEGSVPKLMD